MLPWSQRHPRRFNEELRQLFELNFVLTQQEPLEAEGSVGTRTGEVLVRVQYPRSFPEDPPRVWLLDPETRQVRRLPVPHHSFLDHSLCLFREGGGLRSWRREFSVKSVVERLRELMDLQDTPVLAEHHSDLDLPLVPGGKPLIITPEQADLLRSRPGGWGWAKAVAVVQSGAALLTAIEDHKGKGVSGPDLPAPWKLQPHPFIPNIPVETPERKGCWVSLPDRPWKELAPDQDTLLQRVYKVIYTRDREKLAACEFLILVRKGAVGPLDMMVIWLPFNIVGGNRTGWVHTYKLPDDLFARSRVLTLERLKEAHVALVGLGSLGAPVALHLSQAGVGQLTLFDPDIVRPENLCRYPLGAPFLFMPKALALRARILELNPWASVNAVAASPVGDGNGPARELLNAVLADPKGLIVSTCAVPHIEHHLNLLALEHKRPLVIAAAMGAVEHGRILRVLPHVSACLSCVLMQQRDEPERFPAYNPADPAPGAGAYAGEGLPGLGLDCAELAAITARHCLQTLGRVLGGLAYPDAVSDHLLWGRTGTWIFDSPGELRAVPTTRRPDCPACGEGGEARALSDEEQRERQDLLEVLRP